ncbi:MAG: hypothetical protein IJH76_03450 [Clostridia bacterium]|nr:hypothetical protein [Clostridia bacterium]
MKKENRLYWRRLDNSAKIFPISAGKKYSTVFRFSCVLKEQINPDILKKAVILALEKYQSFKVKMRSGIFWNYFEHNPKDPIIHKEEDYPCKYIDYRRNKNYLFKVTYFDKKINIDIFHSLTDGNNGNEFFKEIVYTYIELCHPKEFAEELRSVKKVEYNTEDSYITNYDKNAKSNASSKKAYILKGDRIKLGAVSAIHEIIDADKLKQICKEHDSTVTQYLSAVLIYSIYVENYLKNNGKKPIKLCIPVNLKKYFPNSKTMSNFFSYITLEAEMKKDNLNTFDKILQFVKDDFKKRLTEEEIIKTMSANVRLGNNPFIKIVPLPLKKAIVRLGYLEIRRYTTITFSNVGRMGIIGKYKPYIDYFLMLIAPEPVEKIKCSAVTYENKMVFTFTSILNDSSIEKRFHEFLTSKGIEVKIESNGVLDVISTKN